MKIIRALALVSAFATAAFAQNAVTLPWAEQQFFNSAGQPLSGGYIYTCTAGSSCGISTPGQPPSTPLATYTNSTGTVQNTNPVVLDSGGRASIWIGTSTAYKIIATTSAGVTQWTQDNVVAYATSAQLTSLSSSLTAFESSLASSTGSTLVGYEASGTGSVARTVASKLGDTVNVKDFGATGNGTTDDTAAITAALATISGGGYVRVPAGTYKLSGSQAVTVGGYTAGGGLLCDNGATFTTASTSASLFNVTSNGRVSGCSVTLPTGYTGSVFTVNSGQNGSAGDIGMEIDHITINGTSSDASGNALQVISTATQNVSILYAH
jgi:hypothetical protein